MSCIRIHVPACLVGACAILGIASDTAWAGSGPSVRSQSVATQGMAQAGMTTGVGGIATMVYNPATLSTTSGRSVELSTGLIVPTGTFRDISASNLFGQPITGGNGSGEQKPALLPSGYFAFNLAEDLRAGLALTSLYGLGSNYAGGWSGRYQATDSELISLIVQPTISWQATPWLAVGAGVQFQYMHSTTEAAIDFGSIDAALAGGAFGGVPGEDDGSFEATQDGWATGYTLGFLVSPAPGTRIGLGYRSAIKQELDGDATYDLGGPVGLGLADTTGAFRATGASSEIDLPANVYLGVQQDFGTGVTVYADFNWMQWSKTDQLAITFDNPLQPAAVTALQWEDSIFLAVGASWDVDERLTLRGGLAYDQGPARNNGATVAIPDGNSIYTAAGLSYRLSETMILDASLGAVFTEDVSVVASADTSGAEFNGNFEGVYDDGRAYFGGLALRIDL